MDWREYIHSDPGILGGKPVFKGTRFTVERVLKLVGAGWDYARIAYEYPGVQPHHLQAAAAFAADMIQDEKEMAIGRARAA
ncbi:MAG TPA: DUF433 domain-containing protein [Allosphingosinicella sp.]|nr:DUF433 domain-containing protein [Allosphingosinicella sp.]